jgi:hypothetical protein
LNENQLAMIVGKLFSQKILIRSILLLSVVSGRSWAQISPGPLSRAHTQLEGLTKCLSCHEAGEQLSNNKCLKCHTAIAVRLEDKRGLHANIMTSAPDRSCASCHSEHNGKEFALIFWEKGEANFDHRQAGYVLAGKHIQAKCRDCHQPKSIQEKFPADPNVRPAKTFLGLSQKCITCHGDEHRGQLNTSCERCHNFDAWKPAAKFAHDQAQFLLTGRHQTVACAKCHFEKPATEKVGKETVAAFVQYTGLQFANCIPCHRDPHQGSFGEACTKCHATDSWKAIRKGSFNHDMTDFPLRGRHINVACEKCHAGGDFKKKVSHARCSDCHRDPHARQFARRADKGKCESCHNVTGFSPSQFTLAQHQTTSFQLAGAHLATPCGLCHARQTAGAFAGKLLFVFPEQRCPACHADVHAGQFAARMAKGSCEVCHLNEGWHQTKFDHNSARFALKGSHQKVVCGKCHPVEKMPARAGTAQTVLVKRSPSNASPAVQVVRYRPLPFRCADCHEDVHRGQFGKKETVRCEKCHQSTHWPELLFMHNRDSAFKLDGAHEKVPCEKCHFAKAAKPGLSVVIYKPLRKECEACHR